MNKEQELKTMMVLGLAPLILFVIFKLKIFLVLSLILLLTGVIGGKLSALIAGGWMKFAHFLGNVNTKVIIFLAYYLMLVPIALLYQIFNKQQVNKFFAKHAEHTDTYFKNVNKKYDKEDLEKMW